MSTSGTNKIHIICDSREPINKIKPIVGKLLSGDRFKNIEVYYKKLDYGDYYIENGEYNITIQRKAISDFVGSYGGLPEQFLHLKMESQRQALLIEGKYTTKMGSGSIWLDRGKGLEEVMKIQTEIRMLTRLHDEGVWIYYTNNLFETIITLFYIGEYLPSLETKKSSGKLPIDDILLAIDGIGTETLTTLKAKYQSPIEALSDIKNWAKKRVREGLESW